MSTAENQNHPSITTIFTDIGGVLLTDGWNRKSRANAATVFNLDLEDFEERHHLTFDTYEVGKISLKEYLDRVVFFKKRSFSYDDFKKFMFEQSQPYPDMIDSLTALKKQYHLKIGVISNEGRELTEYRIRKFGLLAFVDFFISSSFVHLRKPDIDIFQMALDVAQIPAKHIVYIEDRPMFVEVASALGIHGVHHENHQDTMQQLSALGLVAR